MNYRSFNDSRLLIESEIARYNEAWECEKDVDMLQELFDRVCVTAHWLKMHESFQKVELVWGDWRDEFPCVKGVHLVQRIEEELRFFPKMKEGDDFGAYVERKVPARECTAVD